MKAIGWLILLALVELLFVLAWLMPKPQRIAVSMFSNYVPIEPTMQWVGMFVAFPGVVIACLLIGADE